MLTAEYPEMIAGQPEIVAQHLTLADQVAHVAHLNARDTTLVFVSRALQAEIARLKARMGWEMPWFTITDKFDADFGVDEWHGTNVFYRDGERVLPRLLHQQPRRRADGEHLELPRHHAAGSAGGLRRTRPRAILRPRPTSGGTGTTATSPTRRPTRRGSWCRMPERRRSGTSPRARSHEPGSQERAHIDRFVAIALAGFRAALKGRNSRLAKELSMPPLILFGASVAFGLIAWTVVAVRYLWPYLRDRPRAASSRNSRSHTPRCAQRTKRL